MKPVSIRAQAETDIDDVYKWYEHNRPGLGDDFMLKVEAVVEQLRRDPKMYAIVYHGVRRAFLRRFPYGVYCFEDDSRIVIIAVMHGRRDPSAWRNRI